MSSRPTTAAAVGIALVALASAASADKGAVVEQAGDATVDWTAGVVSARGAAAGDLRAPSAAVARVGAQRQATEAARSELLEAARGLTLADGTAVARAADADEAVAARLAAAVVRTRPAEIRYATDGSVTLIERLPLEAIRLAVRGPEAPPPEPDGPTAVIVDATKAGGGPALGLALVAGGERYEGPAVFHRSAKRAAADRRLGDRVVRLTAASRSGAELQLGEGAADEVARLRKAGALVVIVLPGKVK